MGLATLGLAMLPDSLFDLSIYEWNTWTFKIALSWAIDYLGGYHMFLVRNWIIGLGHEWKCIFDLAFLPNMP